MIDLSVVIPIYNAELLIDRCLDSVFSQPGKYVVEVICVDDGSTDHSVEIIKKRKESNIILLCQPNAGPAAARNRGIAAAKGRYVALLDADDYWEPSFIVETVGFLDTYSECIAVSVAQRHITFSGNYLSPSYISEPNHNEEAFVLDDFYSFWAKYNHVCTGSITIRTDIAQQTGGQREELRICEDLEFWAYLATFGKFGFIPKILFISDGNKVTEQIGWVEKHIKRWNSAPTVEKWEQRIITRIGDNVSGAYKKARGRIARNLCYSIIMSKRSELAYHQVRKYRCDFPNGTMTRLLWWASTNKWMWKMITGVLVYREYHR